MLLVIHGFSFNLFAFWDIGRIGQECAIFFNGGPNTNKHNILRAAPSNILPNIKNNIASDKNKTAIISKTVIPALFEKKLFSN